MTSLDVNFKRSADKLKVYRATTKSGDKLKGITSENLLELYGLYKQANFGDNNMRRPSIFNYIGLSKWKAWKALESMSSEDAKQAYIKLVDGKLNSKSYGTTG